jgi:hypothetical protein
MLTLRTRDLVAACTSCETPFPQRLVIVVNDEEMLRSRQALVFVTCRGCQRTYPVQAFETLDEESKASGPSM